MSDHFESFRALIRHPLKYRLFLLQKLPAAYFTGTKIVALNKQSAQVSIGYKWFNKNPFRSTYFAVLSMAAEMSTGILCSAHIYKRQPSVSMLLVNMNGSFYKKATDVITFICNDGDKIQQAAEECLRTGEGVTVVCNSKGYNKAQELTSEFNFTWSFKARK